MTSSLVPYLLSARTVPGTVPGTWQVLSKQPCSEPGDSETERTITPGPLPRPLQTGKPGIWDANTVITFPKMSLEALREGASGWASWGQDGPFTSVSPYLSLVATEAGVGAEARAEAGAGAAARVATAVVGSSSEAGLSLTLSWGVGAENRPDTLKLMSADRRGGLSVPSPPASPLHQGQDPSPFPPTVSGPQFAVPLPQEPHDNPTKQRDHHRFTDETLRLSGEVISSRPRGECMGLPGTDADREGTESGTEGTKGHVHTGRSFTSREEGVCVLDQSLHHAHHLDGRH